MYAVQDADPNNYRLSHDWFPFYRQQVLLELETETAASAALAIDFAPEKALGCLGLYYARNVRAQ
jgi:hypothetical protein